MSYNRMAALTYAGAFYNRVCHDGKNATRDGYPAEINGVKVTPGLALADIGPIPRDFDCTHFISCCLGQGRGRLNIGGREIMFTGGGERGGSFTYFTPTQHAQELRAVNSGSRS